MVDQEATRREFARLAVLILTALATGACGDPTGDSGDSGRVTALCDEHDLLGERSTSAPADLPHLGGAPDDPEGWAIAAFVDVVVPGRHRDPTGAPGAIDVGAAALFFDPVLPALEFVPLLVLALDAQATQVETGATFVELTVEQREQALEQAVEAFAELDFAVQLARLATYSSEGLACHLGYPGPNPGYVHDPTFTTGVAMATELTADGNLD